MRKVLRIVLGIASVIAVPIFIDFFLFGNAFPSNIDNQAWAGFLGSYLGGIATLVAVFITISDNNKKIEIQRQSEKDRNSKAVRKRTISRTEKICSQTIP